jgi:hypothetical protein
MLVWLTVIAWLSLALGFVTAAIIAADEIAHPQRMPIMNIVWPVTGLYFPCSVFGFISKWGGQWPLMPAPWASSTGSGRASLSPSPTAAAVVSSATSSEPLSSCRPLVGKKIQSDS